MNELEAEMMLWPKVEMRRMFGANCFLVNGRMFAFFWKDNVACWVSKKYQESLATPSASRVEIREGIPLGTWIFFPETLGEKLLPWLRAS